MKIDSHFIQNNPAFRSAPQMRHDGGQSNATEKLNQILSQKSDDTATDRISNEMKAKLAELAKLDSARSEDGELTSHQKEAMEILLKNMAFLNDANDIHDQMMERLEGELQASKTKRDKYQSMLDGQTSMSEFMDPALSQEEYEKCPQTQTVQSADGAETVQTISYDQYKSLWDAQQTEVAREEVSTLLQQTQERINRHPERISVAEKCHNFRVALAQSAVSAALKILEKDASGSGLASEFSRLLNQKEGFNEENVEKLLKKMDEMKESDPENRSLYEEMEDLAKDWKTKHLNAKA